MEDEEILDCLDNMSEDEMIEKVIIPLYRKRFKSFRDIEFSGKDKREDEGIDITYYEIGRETGGKEYGGVQVKQGDINTGKGANGIAAIGVQAHQAFNKRIANSGDKKEYRIQGYTVLTTGTIHPKARVQIADQFQHKTIRFVDGKRLAEWIRDGFLDEMKLLCNQCEEPEEDDALDPLTAILDHVGERCSDDIDELRDVYQVLDGTKQDILKVLMALDGHVKATRIAARIGRKVTYLQEDLDSMVEEDLLYVDEDGYCLDSIAAAWSRIKSEAEDRIETLDYAGELSIEHVVKGLFF